LNGYPLVLVSFSDAIAPTSIWTHLCQLSDRGWTMTNMRAWVVGAVLVGCVCSVDAGFAAGGPSVEISQRMKGAERVVVATATRVNASWRRNTHGDQLIVSQVLLQVEETLKGSPGSSAVMEMEGGTLDGFTLRVSDLPEMKVGDRAVFMLDGGSASAQAPHLRGQGILKLDDANHLAGSSLVLNDIRRMSRVIQ
jgi:hypothetical protein